MKNFVLNGASKIKTAKQAKRVWELLGGTILLITVLLYAAFRGKYAYEHLPTQQESFVFADEIAFPVVTLCPVNYRYPLVLRKCVKQTALQRIQTRDVCENSMYVQQVNIKGVDYPCMTMNDPKGKFIGPYPPLTASSLADQIRIELFTNSSSMAPNIAIGAIVILHTNTTKANLSDGNSFVADASKTNYGIMKRIFNKYLNGDTNSTFKVQTSVATLSGSSTDNIEIILSFGEQGFYISTEYYDYTPFNWFGEVGGFACLMLFLHWTIAFFVEVLFVFRGKRKETSHLELQ